jgi:hypothetical protein
MATFIRVSNAMTETAKVLARIEAAPALSAHALLALGLPLPRLPRLPEEGGVPPRKIRKQPQALFPIRSTGSSPASGGGP